MEDEVEVDIEGDELDPGLRRELVSCAPVHADTRGPAVPSGSVCSSPARPRESYRTDGRLLGPLGPSSRFRELDAGALVPEPFMQAAWTSSAGTLVRVCARACVC
ncbi:hypothetical protein EYF80_058318 [Liparis tanakae]|uniref:Uncharacterized protein n=1 Tax=Liparis tanakae TaxID=230148 RepID=A0A4Z2ERU1_9TELE|nr:hypothetical protein EYF80_058318 [Liparis tanakae]